MRAILLTAVLAFLLAGCGDNRNDRTQTAGENPQAPQAANRSGSVSKTRPEAVKKPDGSLPVISELKFAGPAQTSSDLEIQASLAVPDNQAIMEYRWFVNNQEIYDNNDPVLPREKFSSGDWVQCWVTARSGDRESRMVKSKHIKIVGTPPVLNPAPIESFEVPGQFQYRIQAIDPDAGPYDPPTLSYALLSPRDAGIALNPETGEISWDISEDTIKKFGEKVEIKFKVGKKGCADVSSSITLTFTPPEPEKKQKNREP